jgi:hypothetical protein
VQRSFYDRCQPWQNTAIMKKNPTIRLIAFLLAVLPVSFSACVKDQCKKTHSYTYYVPVYKDKPEVINNIKSNSPRDIEKTGKFYVFGNYIFLNEVDKGVHVIDNSDPSHPRNIAFIDIPGDLDLAVKGNILYADMYKDLVAIDISNPSNVVLKKTIADIFPERYYSNGFSGAGDKIIVDWRRVDTTVTETCERSSWGPLGGDVFLAQSSNSGTGGSSASSPVGMGGSMARFTIVNDFMYAVDHHTLRSISVSNAADPVMAGNISAGWDIETIYSFKNKLFVGSMGGMFIFDITNPATPISQSSFGHARACDPVIADDNYAYITLRSGTNCGPTSNELQIVNVQNLQSPSLVKAYPMIGPQGLSKDNNLLFICDGSAGVKVYNAADVMNLQLVKTVNDIEPSDVIAYNNIAVVVAKDGLYQYDYSDINNIRLLSKVVVIKN